MTPAGNVDVAPTSLALLGIEERDGMDGRVLIEALAAGPDVEHVTVDARTPWSPAGIAPLCRSRRSTAAAT